MKLQPSLIRHRVGLLELANTQFVGTRNIKFAYADMYGALKVVFNTPIRNNPIFEFKTNIEEMEILTLADGLDDIA